MAMEVEEYPRHDEKNELAAWNSLWYMIYVYQWSEINIVLC